MAVLELCDVKKHYGRGRRREEVLRGVDLAMEEGELLGFLGRNGAGKSTTIGIACTLIAPSSGKVEVCGHDAVKRPMMIRREIGLVPEDSGCYSGMTGRRMLRYLASFYDIPWTDIDTRIDEIAGRLELSEMLDKSVEKCSFGNRRKLALAQALVHGPRLLVLDEPFGGLDLQSRAELTRILKELNDEGTSVLLSTHNISEVQSVCKQVAVIDQGRMIMTSSTKEMGELVTVKRALVVESDTFPDEALDVIKRQPGVVEVKRTQTGLEIEGSWEASVPAEVYGAISNQGVSVRGIYLKEPDLGEVFVKLTSKRGRGNGTGGDGG